MFSAKQKAKDAAAVVAEHAEIAKAKVEEKAQKAMARNKTDKEIAEEVRKAREAEAKMKMHNAKARHAEEKLIGKHHHTVAARTYPPAGNPPHGPTAPASY